MKEPDSLLNNLSKKLQDVFIVERNKLVQPTMDNYTNTDTFKEDTQRYKRDFKIYENAFKNIGNSKYTKGCIDYLKLNYTVDRLDDMLDAKNNLLAFDDQLFDISKNEFRKIQPADFITKTCKRNAPIEEQLEKQKYIKEILFSIFEIRTL